MDKIEKKGRLLSQTPPSLSYPEREQARPQVNFLNG
jgi:hypothetical protein